MKWIHTTCENQEEARKIAKTLLEEKLVACVQILPDIKSIYLWQGAIEEAAEVGVYFKTIADKADRAMARIEELHSYDCPCIVKINIEDMNPSCREWLNQLK